MLPTDKILSTVSLSISLDIWLNLNSIFGGKGMSAAGGVTTGSPSFAANSTSSGSSAQAFEASLNSLDGTVTETAENDSFQDEMKAIETAVATASEAEETAAEEAEEIKFLQEVDEAAVEGDVEASSHEHPDDAPASDGTHGKREYTAANGDTIESIAAAYGQSVDDLLLANPQLAVDNTIRAGQTIAVYDEGRLEIAREMAATNNPEELKELARREILYATSNSATPEDLLPAIKDELLARRGTGDSKFEKIVQKEAAWTIELWTRQGRTHEIMDRFQYLTSQGDTETLQQEIFAHFRATALRSPTSEAIQSQAEIFLRYGPQDPSFAEAVNASLYEFDHGQIERAAQELEASYQTSGVVSTSDLLAHFTSPSIFDALSATRLLQAAQDTISQMISHLGLAEVQSWLFGDIIPVTRTELSLSEKEKVFGNLCLSVQRVSKCGESAEIIRDIAAEVNSQMFTYVALAIMEGKGAALPGQMMLLDHGYMLYPEVNMGLHGLRVITDGLISAMNLAARDDDQSTDDDPIRNQLPNEAQIAADRQQLHRMVEDLWLQPLQQRGGSFF